MKAYSAYYVTVESSNCQETVWQVRKRGTVEN